MLFRPFLLGAVIAAPIAYMLYMNSNAYAAFIDWQFAHPLVWLLGLPVGIAVAVLTD